MRDGKSPSQVDTPLVVTIGSAADNTIQMAGVFPSHARVECRALDCIVEDLTREQAGTPQTFLAPADEPGLRLPILSPQVADYDDTIYLGRRRLPLAQLRPQAIPQPAAASRSPAPSPTPAPSPAPAGAQTGQVGTRIFVGTDPKNRVVVPSPGASRTHAEIHLRPDECLVRDCSSQNGTWWIDPRDPTQRHRVGSQFAHLGYDQTILLGSYPLPLSRLRDIKDIPVVPDTFVDIGRAPDNGRVLDRVAVTSRHARITFQQGRILVEDRGSVGGTFLNGRRLGPFSPRELGPDDRVRIAAYNLYIDPAAPSSIRVDYSGAVALDIDTLGCDIGDKKVLRDVSLSIRPGEMVGILGPSGHGKSVLLECLVQRKSLRVTGSIRLNGHEVRDHLDACLQVTGYVPQGEVLPLHLTVEEVLGYAARLWCRSDLSSAEVDRQTGLVLDRMNLPHCRKQPLRVLSGGELRRVSIAHELIRSPRLLLLDEPTTGLSTRDARGVIRSLRRLADEGHTVVGVIHQPSRDVFSLFHQVAILFSGRILYYGPPPLSYPFFGCDDDNQAHPEDIFTVLERYERELEIAPKKEEKLGEWTRRFRESPEYEKYVAQRMNGT